MFRQQFLPFLLSTIILSINFLFSEAQVTIPNGDFEQWEDRFVFETFAPYQTSNTFTFASGSAPNVTSVTGDNGGKAIRIETIKVNGGIQEGVIYAGSVHPVPEPGFPFSGNPDSVFLHVRYDIQPGDSAGLVIAFFANGSQVGGMFWPVAGQNTNWHTLGFDLPGLSASPDSITLLLASSWYDTTPGIVGSWLELDEISFDDNSTLMNGSFEQVDSLLARDPVSWISPNDFSLVFEDGDMIATEAIGADAYMGGTSLRLTTQSLEFGNDSDTVGFIQNTQTYLNDFGAGQAYTGLAVPQTFRGYYKYLPVGNDTALMYMLFTVWDSIGDSSRVIGDYYGRSFAPENDYTSFTLELNLSEKPDSFFLAFSASDVDQILSNAKAGIGSELYIDEIEFYDGATSIEVFTPEPKFNFYPNPATDYLKVSLDAKIDSDYQISIHSFNGQKVFTGELPASVGGIIEYELSVGHLKKGLYILSITDSKQGNTLSKRLMIE